MDGSSAIIDLNQTNSATSAVNVDLYGNLIANDGTLLSTDDGCLLRFVGSAIQYIDVENDVAVTNFDMSVENGAEVKLENQKLDIGNNTSITVKTGATFDFSFDGSDNPLLVSEISGSSNTEFVQEAGATLKITSAQGIDKDAADLIGNLRTDVRTFSTEGIFHYMGKTNQVAGDGLPAATSAKTVIVELDAEPLTFAATSTTRFNSGGTFEIREGTVNDNGSSFFADGTLGGESGNLIMTGGIYKFNYVVSSPSSGTLYPRLSGTYTLSGGLIELAANTGASQYQRLRGGKTYHKLKISGNSSAGGYKDISSSVTVNNNVEITGTAIFDIFNRALSGNAGLTMDGGLLRISKLSNTILPELEGTVTPYALSGGTIEFYGSAASGTGQLIRAEYNGSTPVNYFNIEVNANGSNTADYNVNAASPGFILSGTMNVNSPAVFQLDVSDVITGTGDFRILPGSTFKYANAIGIEASGSNGAVQTGSRSFPSTASYGFVGNSNQQTGSGLPAQMVNLYLQKGNTSATVNLTNSVRVSQNFEMLQGNMNTAAFQIELGTGTGNLGNLSYTDGHVIGIMKRWFNGTNTGNASGLFPIGVGGADRFATVEYGTAPSAGGSLTARFVSSAMGLSGLPITGIAGTCATFDASTTADEGYWQIDDADGLSGGDYDITLVGEGISTITDLFQVTALKRVGGGNWIENGTHTDPTGTIARPIVKRTAANGWSNWGFGGSPINPLPVVMGSFTAVCKSEGILLNWVTLSELNSARFEIEQSTDLIHFEYVDLVSAAGNSNEPIAYEYKLNRPNLSLTQYFRLKQEDFDGAFEYFGPVAVSCQEQQAITIVVQGFQLNIGGLSANNEALTLKIFDLNGKELRKEIIPSYGNLVSSIVDISTFNSGIYFIHLTSSTFSHTQKIVVTH